MDQKQLNLKIRSEVEKFTDGFRTQSAAFLIWYLANFFRLTEQDAKDAVCDEKGDKGIDGIWVDETEDEEEIYLFQSKFSPNDEANQGDRDLRDFVGAKGWLKTAERVKELMTSTANHCLKSIILSQRIEEMVLRGAKLTAIFITNKTFDPNAEEYLAAHKDELEGYDIQRIYNKYSYIEEEESVNQETNLLLSNPTCIEYRINGIKVNVFSIQAKELLKLGGIRNSSLFARNVRYGLGRTRVNKDITSTLQTRNEHVKFFLYHNGITIICEKLSRSEKTVKLSNYSVVNGCQSVLTFYENADVLSNEIFVLTKIIELPVSSKVTIRDITYWTNNQNAISVRDLKANDPIQISLQRDFEKFFDHKVLYRRQKGDTSLGYVDIIERDFAAQLIAAFYLCEPNITYTRDRLFTDRYYDIFSIHTNAPKIFLANRIYQVIDQNSQIIEFVPIRNYGLAKFFILHVIGELLRADPLGKDLVKNPSQYVKGSTLIILTDSIKTLFQLLVLDADNFIKDWKREHDNFFDYKNFFKNSRNVEQMTQSIITSYKKHFIHHPEETFQNIFKTASAKYQREHLA